MSIKWNLVEKDGYPKRDGEYLVTVKKDGINTNCVRGYTDDLSTLFRYDYLKGVCGFYSDESKYEHKGGDDIVAWAEEIKPYNEMIDGRFKKLRRTLKEYKNWKARGGIDWKSVKKDGYPKEDGEYLVTIVGFLEEYIETLYYTNNLYECSRSDFCEYKDEVKKGFFSYTSRYGCIEREKVIAWAKVEPYKEKK